MKSADTIKGIEIGDEITQNYHSADDDHPVHLKTLKFMFMFMFMFISKLSVHVLVYVPITRKQKI